MSDNVPAYVQVSKYTISYLKNNRVVRSKIVYRKQFWPRLASYALLLVGLYFTNISSITSFILIDVLVEI